MGTTKAHGDAKALRGTNRNVGTPVAWRLHQSQGQQVSGGHNLRVVLMRLGSQCLCEGLRASQREGVKREGCKARRCEVGCALPKLSTTPYVSGYCTMTPKYSSELKSALFTSPTTRSKPKPPARVCSECSKNRELELTNSVGARWFA